jgi:hypothetical protein
MIRDWHAKAYRPNFYKYDQEGWNLTKQAVIERDKSTCQSCMNRRKDLSVHHIIPRDEGGSDDLFNLVTLCFHCHDEIEQTNIRSIWQIKGYNLPEEKVKRKKAAQDKNTEIDQMLERIDQARPDWHAVVYGGCKKKNGRRIVK